MCETPTFFRAEARIARKQHRCCECGRVITINEIHEVSIGVWNHTFTEYRTCAECFDIREDLREDMLGLGFIYDDEAYCALAFENLRNELAEHCRESA